MMNKRKMQKELIPANDDRFSALWEGSEKFCFEPVSKQINEWRTSKTSLEYYCCQNGTNKNGYHNPSLWQILIDQIEGLS